MTPSWRATFGSSCWPGLSLFSGSGSRAADLFGVLVLGPAHFLRHPQAAAEDQRQDEDQQVLDDRDAHDLIELRPAALV